MSEIKPLLRQMIDNNKPYWRPATIRGAHKQLDEYEAKAKAFDAIVEQHEEIMKEVRNRKFKVTSDVTLLGLKVEKEIKKYERGESE